MTLPPVSSSPQKADACIELVGSGRRSRPAERRCNRRPAAAVADQQQSARRIDDVREGLDDPLAERRCVGTGPAERFGEPEPLGAIVVPMLEQMLGELDLGPAARPALGMRTIAPTVITASTAPSVTRTNRRRYREAPSPGSPSRRSKRKSPAARATGRSPRARGEPATRSRCASPGEQRRSRGDRKPAPLDQPGSGGQ